MSWMSSFLSPAQPYKDAQQQRENYYQQGQGYLDPYNQGGQQAGGQLQGALTNLMNPQQLQDEWMKSYQTSEQGKQLQNQATQSGLDTAGSMGLMGSQPALQAIQGGTANIGMQDRQNYLQDLMDKYKTGIGLGENLYGVGANAAGQQSSQAQTMGQDSAETAFGQSAAPGKMFGKTLGTAAKLGTDYLTGGFGTGSFGRGAWAT